MPDESEPKLKRKLTEREATRQVMQETLLFTYQKAFRVVKEKDPTLAEKLKPQFDELMETVQAMIKENPDELPNIYLVEKRLPNNPWVTMIKKSIETSPRPEGSKERSLEEIRQQTKKRMKGGDIH